MQSFIKDHFNPAAQRLIDDVGNNLAILDKHLEKLSIYLGERTTISEQDVNALVGGGQKSNGV